MTHFIEVFLKRSTVGFNRLKHFGDLAELSIHRRGRNHGAAAAITGRRPGIGHILAVAQRGFRIGNRPGVLFDRHRLAGQRSFLDLKVDRLDEPHVGRHAVARLQQNDVAGNQMLRRNFKFLAVAQHRRRGRRHFAQGINRPFRPEFLNEAQSNGKQYDHANNNRLDRIAHKRRKRRRRQQNDNQHVLELIEQQTPRRHAAGGLKFVRPVFLQTTKRLRRTQSDRAGFQFRQRRLHGQRMPDRIHR